MLGTVTNVERDVIGQCSQSWLGKAFTGFITPGEILSLDSRNGRENKLHETEKDSRLQVCNKSEQIS